MKKKHETLWLAEKYLRSASYTYVPSEVNMPRRYIRDDEGPFIRVAVIHHERGQMVKCYINYFLYGEQPERGQS